MGFAGSFISSPLPSWCNPSADKFFVAIGIRFRRDITQEGGQEWNWVDVEGGVDKIRRARNPRDPRTSETDRDHAPFYLQPKNLKKPKYVHTTSLIH